MRHWPAAPNLSTNWKTYTQRHCIAFNLRGRTLGKIYCDGRRYASLLYNFLLMIFFEQVCRSNLTLPLALSDGTPGAPFYLCHEVPQSLDAGPGQFRQEFYFCVIHIQAMLAFCFRTEWKCLTVELSFPMRPYLPHLPDCSPDGYVFLTPHPLSRMEIPVQHHRQLPSRDDFFSSLLRKVH